MEFRLSITTKQESRQVTFNRNCDASHRTRPTDRAGARPEEWESADKPGSVVGNHSSGMHVAVHLERPTREHARAARCCREQAPGNTFPYLVLLRTGFAVPCLLPGTRCAL